jgi:hypothetical protein
VHVEDTTPEAAVEALDDAVLHGPSRLDEVELDAFAFCPFRERQSPDQLDLFATK